VRQVTAPPTGDTFENRDDWGGEPLSFPKINGPVMMLLVGTWPYIYNQLQRFSW